MNRVEKLFYHRCISLAISKLAGHNRLQKYTVSRKVFSSCVVVNFDGCNTRYLIKYCPKYWKLGNIELTGQELKMASKCSGVVFVMGKGEPSYVRECDYDVLLCSPALMANESAHHLRGVRQFICHPFAFQYHPSRLLTNGHLL